MGILTNRIRLGILDMCEVYKLEQTIQWTPANKNLHFLRCGEKVLLFWGSHWQFTRAKMVFHYVLNFHEGEIVADNQKNKETWVWFLNIHYLFKTVHCKPPYARSMKTTIICTFHEPFLSNTSICNYSLVQYLLVISTGNFEVKLLG